MSDKKTEVSLKPKHKFLNDQEQAKIAMFTGDTVMFEAVRKVLLASIYDNGVMKPGEAHEPLINGLGAQAIQAVNNRLPISDKELGQNIRAQAAGILAIESGFKELGRIAEPGIVSPMQPRTNVGK